MSTEPLLSYVITGRDDDYMPDFKYRLRITLEFLCANARAIGRLQDMEVLVVDWGSPKPLSESVPVSAGVRSATHFLHVPKDITDCVQDGRWSFHTTISANVGVRRARGRFVLSASADQLMPQPALRAVFDLLDGTYDTLVDLDHTFFLIPRKQVPWSFVERHPSLDEWRRFCTFSMPQLDDELASLAPVNSGMAGVLMSRAGWHEVRGLDEQLGGWGWSDIDLALRVTRDRPWLDLTGMGVYLLHLEHRGGGRATVLQTKLNVQRHQAVTAVNGDDWGMSELRLERLVPATDTGSEYTPEPTIEVPSNGSASLDPERFARALRTRIEHLGQDRFEETDLDALALLATYAGARFPRTFVEIGAADGETCFVVADQCPAVDICVIDEWNDGPFRRTPREIAAYLKFRVRHHGYIRIINAEPLDGLERWFGSWNAPRTVDLAFVRTSRRGPACSALLVALWSRVSTGGAVVVSGAIDRDLQGSLAATGEASVSSLTCERHGTTILHKTWQPDPISRVDACPSATMEGVKELFHPSRRTVKSRAARTAKRALAHILQRHAF